MARITVEDCQERVDNRFLLVQMTIKRVQQYREGYEALVDSRNKEIVTALREIAAGKIIPEDRSYYCPLEGQDMEALLSKKSLRQSSEDSIEPFSEKIIENTVQKEEHRNAHKTEKAFEEVEEPFTEADEAFEDEAFEEADEAFEEANEAFDDEAFEEVEDSFEETDEAFEDEAFEEADEPFEEPENKSEREFFDQDD